MNDENTPRGWSTQRDHRIPLLLSIFADFQTKRHTLIRVRCTGFFVPRVLLSPLFQSRLMFTWRSLLAKQVAIVVRVPSAWRCRPHGCHGRYKWVL